MKKKGFTLIELLAVIIILAIVALVATPIILNVVNDAKKSAGLSETKMIYSGINNYCEEAKLREQLNGTESICKDGVTIEEVSQMVNLGNAKIIKLTYVNKVTELTVESNGYTYTLKDGEIVLGEDTGSEEEVANCTYAGELVQGAEHESGAYIYRYKQKMGFQDQGTYYETYWENMDEDGWTVHINPKYMEETEITTPICSEISGKPIVNVSYMFAYSPETSYSFGSQSYVAQATSINLKGFDTSRITDLSNMFSDCQATTLDLSGFDTSNVTDMSGMFSGIQATVLDLSNFDTSKVTNMSSMFSSTNFSNFDLTQLDTSNVTNMSGIFQSANVSALDFSNFDTSNVTNMSYMFEGSKATSLDLSSLNTSKVTDMSYMFWESQIKTLNFSNSNTSNVTSMESMFRESQIETLNLSNLNTSSVTNMYRMFDGNQTKTLDLSSFNTSNVTNMEHMFSYSHATSLDLSNFNTSNVTNMGYMFNGSHATNLDLSSFDTSKVTNMHSMFKNSQAEILDLSSFKLNDNVNSANGKMSYMFEDAKATIGYARTQAEATHFNSSMATKIPDTLKFVVKP